jgi:hypothetical protein
MLTCETEGRRGHGVDEKEMKNSCNTKNGRITQIRKFNNKRKKVYRNVEY